MGVCVSGTYLVVGHVFFDDHLELLRRGVWRVLGMTGIALEGTDWWGLSLQVGGKKEMGGKLEVPEKG